MLSRHSFGLLGALFLTAPCPAMADDPPGGGGGGVPAVTRSPQAGLPRPWEAGVSVSPWSVVNLYNGNILTELTLAEFGAAGPAVRFTLFHNGASGAGSPMASPNGYTLGPGWSTSYGGAIIDNHDGTVTLLEDDGNQYDFTLTSGQYVPESGVHDHLAYDETADQWVLTRTDQWQRIFDADGRLLEVRDSAGLALTIQRDAQNNHRITSIVAPEGGGELAFAYDGQRLVSVTAVDEPAEPVWEFEYDANGRLETLHYPGGATLTFAYNTANRITTITDDTGAAWDYGYNNSPLLRSVLDPPDPNQDRAQQLLSYPLALENGLVATWYTDRAGQQWRYLFSTSGNFRKRRDPDGQWIELSYDADRNVTSFDDGQGNEITMSWGVAATLNAVSIPASGSEEETTDWNHLTLVWEQPAPEERPNFWRRTEMYDTFGNHVEYGYDEGDPAVLAELIETAPNASSVVLDPGLNAFPVTGLGTAWRMYWSHPGPDSLAPIERAMAPLEARVSPGDPPVQTGAYDWRWRYSWVFPPVGLHIGIDYIYNNSKRHVDYGRKWNCSGCTCCNYLYWTNSRYKKSAPYTTVFGAGYTSWYGGTSQSQNCFESGLPWHWGACCKYYFLGVPYPYSNSNGGAHKSIHTCLSNPQHPPLNWTLFAPGWGNYSQLTANNNSCPGYCKSP
jgi:YD repeat-containing protein